MRTPHQRGSPSWVLGAPIPVGAQVGIGGRVPGGMRLFQGLSAPLSGSPASSQARWWGKEQQE